MSEDTIKSFLMDCIFFFEVVLPGKDDVVLRVGEVVMASGEVILTDVKVVICGVVVW